jgi:ribose transport system ATP-binding protein
MTADASAPAIELREISRYYGAAAALDRASLTVRRGEIHGLIGQNGAGKSTLMKILSGLEQADGGEIRMAGETVAALTPAEVLRRGIAVIYQDRMTIPNFTVEEALFYASPAASSGGITLNRRALRRRAEAIIARYFGIGLPPGALLRELSTSQQQIVHITRSLLAEPRIVIFDEPTAALAQREVESLFRAIEAMRASGITVIYISHYLREILDLCDRVTVLRNGRDVATRDTDGTTIAELTGLMIGSEIGALFPPQEQGAGEPLLEVDALSLRDAFAEVSFDLRRGEVLGVTGLIGSGIKELGQVLFGLQRPARGTMWLKGAPYAPRHPRDALTAGFALVPEDRRVQGVGLPLSVRENVVLASLARFSPRFLMRRAAESARTRHFIEALDIKTPGLEAPVSGLSGGNQQKVAIAKWLCREAEIYVLDEPSVGIDVAAKAEIYRLLRQLAKAGNGLIVISSDHDEVLGLCDRILVFHRGGIALDAPASTLTPARLLATAVAGKTGPVHEPAID